MMANPKRRGALVLRLMVGLALLGWPRVSNAQGTWSVVSLPQQVEVGEVGAMAVDAAGNLYVGDEYYDGLDHFRIQKRDVQGKWSVLATEGDAPGQVRGVKGLAVDTAGNLYVADNANDGRIQKRDAQGNWVLIAVDYNWGVSVAALAADGAGNLYVGYAHDDQSGAKWPYYWIQKRDTQGNWSFMAPHGVSLDPSYLLTALAVDTEGNLYVAEDFGYDPNSQSYLAQIRRRDAQGVWSVIASGGKELGEVTHPIAPAVDTAGNLYVAEYQRCNNLDGCNGVNRIQKRDAQGNWIVIADQADQPDLLQPSALAVDSAGNLYVAEYDYIGCPLPYGGFQIRKRDAQGNWSVLATEGDAPGQVRYVRALAADTAGNLYVADGGYLDYKSRIQKRAAQGNWSVIANFGADALAVDGAGNLYVVNGDQVLKYTPAP